MPLLTLRGTEKEKAYTVIKTLNERLEFKRNSSGPGEFVQNVMYKIKGVIFPPCILKLCLVIIVPFSNYLFSWILHSFFKVFSYEMA